MVLESGWGLNLENQNNCNKFSVCKFVTRAISKIVLSQSFSWKKWRNQATLTTLCNLQFQYLMASMIIENVTWDLASLQGIFEFDWHRCRRVATEATQEQQKLVDESKLKYLRPKIIVFKRLINQLWSRAGLRVRPPKPSP